LFFERPQAGTSALLIHITDRQSNDTSFAEFQELVLSAQLKQVASCVVSLRYPVPATYMGKGKVEEIRIQADAAGAQMILVNKDITPAQERNLEALFQRRVMGRTGLILEIFSQRARTHEGKLQVELAQLKHASTRLVRGWTHLDRQRGTSGRGQGAFGGLGGAGETQLEVDQRLLQIRMHKINQRLEKVRKQRAQNRNARSRAAVKTVSLVGYTNAGKSTLFNRLCEAQVFAADQLFATLDPTLRRLHLDGIGDVILSDTVGFISDLPHTLIDAFRATLEEVRQADLLLHVVDASTPDPAVHIDQVNDVLEEIGAGDVPQLMVYNKVDITGLSAGIRLNAEGMPGKVSVSALTGEGMDALVEAMGRVLSDQMLDFDLILAPAMGAVRARLFALGAVNAETVDASGNSHLQLHIEEKKLRQLVKDNQHQKGFQAISEQLPFLQCAG